MNVLEKVRFGSRRRLEDSAMSFLVSHLGRMWGHAVFPVTVPHMGPADISNMVKVLLYRPYLY